MEDTRARWDRAFVEAVDFDTWGQVEEATEGYQRLQVAAAAEYVENVLQLSMNRRDGIGKLATALKLRVQELQNSTDNRVGLKGMKALKPYMKEIIVSDALFPLRGLDPEAVLGIVPVEERPDTFYDQQQQPEWEREEEDESKPGPSTGNLRGRPPNLKKGDRILCVFVDKWGFKEGASTFKEPQVSMSVRDQDGELVEAVQETPYGRRISSSSNYVQFETEMYVQTSLNKLGNSCAIFFEFKHYKADKKKKSCKCYCFMEMDEVRAGPVTLEVYKKPTIYKRNKKPVLLSVKPFYLHLHLTVETINE
ncbi:hypothetical protein CEUSTIGMA_g8822.t1 [Chlamydomonas eustigma]|uniref:C2 Aida-type domain-containing protein n=1 Tax=Chlamydomonas eustigma TaxID=1157962 RepID=A0A250XEB4_9CHLO|nr:hypothetical protein CEUSTIGMA_g8822.t1 [Chlamydomonas eustigma]|eukprot:GAX81391.1 hypothetical protein CEUSTIGMA_g8822.t1 [Chlamydomonas eustigma]